jgi:hypothetical protein
MHLVISTWVLVVVTISAIVYQVRETKRSRNAAALATYRDFWESDRMRSRRRRLALALLEEMTVETIPAAAIEEVLNFFEDLATAYREKYLSLYSLYSMFHDDAIHYWFAIGIAYTRECRKDPEVSQEYRDFELMVRDLQSIERQKTKSAPEPNTKDLRKFLEVESQLDQPILLKSGKSV